MEEKKKIKNNDELVSIIVPVYNAQKFLSDTINSVLEQSYNNFELILVNDCSKDNSKNIYTKFMNDNRIKWIEQEKNGGAALARNKGIEIANGRYICFLDADDKWDKDKITKQVNFMKKKKCAFSFTGYQFADENCIPNILAGKMSFIGPRPWITDYYDNMNEEQRHRVDVTPGLTGVAQAKGRNNLSVFDKINYDLQYIDNYSLYEDVKVIFLTIQTVLSKAGADAGKGIIKNELEDLRKFNKKIVKG